MINLKFASTAVMLESGALAVLFSDQPPGLLLLAFLSLHAAASACLALFVWILMPSHYQRPRRWALAFLFAFSFFIPFMGLIGLFVGVLVASYLPRLRLNTPFRNISVPEYNNLSGNVKVSYGQGGLRARLQDTGASLESRMKALMAIQQMPSRDASPLLREMLSDPSDDIRLVAYGMLDQREKAINQKITLELAAIAGEQAETQRHASVRHLAELYWELIYQGLVQGDVRKHALEQSMDYTVMALEFVPGDAGMWVLQGKLITALGQVQAAVFAFRNAIDLGFPRTRLLPYLAEIAYTQRDFAEVKRLLSEMSTFDNSDKTLTLTRFWRINKQAGT